MKEERKTNIISASIILVIALFFVGISLIEDHEVSESIVTYVIHNPDGTQTQGNVIFNDNGGMLRPYVTSAKGTSKLKAGGTTLSSNGTFEIISVKHYRSYYVGGPLSKHKREKK